MLVDPLATKIVDAIRTCLLGLERTRGPGTPLFDVGWLRGRCEATLKGGDDYWCRLSLRQLKKDVAQFDEEFPGLLERDLVHALENLTVRV